MSSWLVIDWDQDQFHLLSVQTARRGLQVMHAVTWRHPEPFTPSTAERVGKALRDVLKTEKIAAAPVLAGIGRDRILLKELRFPAIAPHEEPALVRFQTAKELTEPVDQYAIDYAHLHSRDRDGDRQIMTVAARRDFVNSIQTLCQAAGLKLHAVTPRLFGSGAALAQAMLPEASPLTARRRNAVLTIGQRWAELSFYRGERLVQAQALAKGTHLVSEVKRNLAVFQAQHAVEMDVVGPECVYVFGDDAATIETLQGTLRLPIVVLDPLGEAAAHDAQIKNPGAFAGAMGLALLWSQSREVPVNLISPKRGQAPVSVTRQRGMIYGGAAALILLTVIGGMYYIVASKQAEAQRLAQEKKEKEDFLTAMTQERAEIDAYKEWEQTTIPWLYELYDLTARFPTKSGIRVNQFSATTVSKKNAKDGFVGKINLNGITPNDKENYVHQLNTALARDPHLKTFTERIKHPGVGTAPLEYQMKIEVAKQSAAKYDTRLVLPPLVMVAPPPAPKKQDKQPDPAEELFDGEEGKP